MIELINADVFQQWGYTSEDDQNDYFKDFGLNLKAAYDILKLDMRFDYENGPQKVIGWEHETESTNHGKNYPVSQYAVTT